MAARWLELGGDALTDWLDFGADARAIRDAAREARLTQMRVVESSNITLVGSAEELELLHIYAPWSRWAVVGQGLPVSGPPAGGAVCADRTGLLFEADLEEERDRLVAGGPVGSGFTVAATGAGYKGDRMGRWWLSGSC